jgi:hypothetical protein
MAGPDTGAPYRPPPTPTDKNRSITHHASSSGFNLRHGMTHVDASMGAPDAASRDYNLQHAQGHAAEALKHVRALNDRLQTEPRFASHYDALGSRDDGGPNAPARDGGDTLLTPRTESTDRDTLDATRDVPSARDILSAGARDTESPREDATESRAGERAEQRPITTRMPTGRLTARDRGRRR